MNIELSPEWLPHLTRRYLVTVIDWVLVLSILPLAGMLWPGNSAIARSLRVATIVGAFLIYEPLLTGHFVTLGQKLMGVRVLRFDTGDKIGVLRAYERIIVKILLGAVSFVSLPFTLGRRALHDKASGSIVIAAACESEFVEWAKSGPDLRSTRTEPRTD